MDNHLSDYNSYEKFLVNIGLEIPRDRIVLEKIESNLSLKHRSEFLKLINKTMKEGDVLLIMGFDSLGCDFVEIYYSVKLIFKKNIRLICIDFSKNEITGDIKKIFLHFLKLCSDFEGKVNLSKKVVVKKVLKKVGRPEKLNKKQKDEVISMFKNGHTIYSISKHFSVSRTVINRIIEKSLITINLEGI